MNKAVFLDRDGTINIEKNYLYKIEDFEFIPGVFKALRTLQEAGFKLIIITNQSGIGRGYYTEREFKTLNSWMIKEFISQKIMIDAVYYCPHLPDAVVKAYKRVCNCRKPNIGLFENAIYDFDLDINQCWAIGDKIRDCAICEKTECQGVLIGGNEKRGIINDVISGKYKNIYYSSTILEAAQTILKYRR